MPLKKTEGELYEDISQEETWKINALRARMETFRNTVSEQEDELLSLKDILKKTQSNEYPLHPEAYVMLDEVIDNKEDHTSAYHDSTLIVKRTNLLFSGRECVVLNFEDITSIKKLKKEEEKSKMMSILYSSVHHEMIGPLKSNEEAAVRLIRGLKDNNLRM